MTASAAAVTRTPVLTQIPITEITPSPLNPRKHLNPVYLNELAASIRQKGVRSPLQVRAGKKGYEIIAGERRWRASQLAELDQLPCIVTECSDAELVELALTENGQREDLTPMDEARAYQAAMKANPKHYTVSVVAATVGKSESYVYRRLKLLELAKPLQEALDEARLSIAHAERLVKLSVADQLKAAGIERGKFDGGGVVWRFSPLFESAKAEKDAKPGLEDLQPLHALDSFIRNKTFFNPTADDVKYLQPELAEQIDSAVADFAGDDADDNLDAAVRSTLVSVTTDSMARSRIGLKANDPMPLVPSKWREVKPGKECEYTRPGVITHGSEARVLKVCIAKNKCKKHWPVAKKAKASTATKKAAAPVRDTWEEQQKKREAEQRAWDQVAAEALPKLADFTKSVKFSAALVASVLERYQLEKLQRLFGVKLTDETAAHVLLLSGFTRTEWRDEFLRDVKAIAPKFLPELQRIEAAQKKAAAAQAEATAKTPAPAKTNKAAKKGKKR